MSDHNRRQCVALASQICESAMLSLLCVENNATAVANYQIAAQSFIRIDRMF
jgi:hypothetical protein